MANHTVRSDDRSLTVAAQHGNWREDHLFSLEQSLQMYDAIGERMQAYEKEILRRL